MDVHLILFSNSSITCGDVKKGFVVVAIIISHPASQSECVPVHGAFLLSDDVQRILRKKVDGMCADSGTLHHYDTHTATLVSLWVDYGQVRQWAMQGPCTAAKAARLSKHFDQTVSHSATA